MTGSASDYVKPLGFMQEDFVYGVAKSADVVVDAAGNTLFPMYQVKIMDTSSEEHEVLKTYEKPGYYVQNIAISGYTIYLNRIQNNGAFFFASSCSVIRTCVSFSSVFFVAVSTTFRLSPSRFMIMS